jgi:ankyrin repeat protein
MSYLSTEDPLAVEPVAAIRAGDVEALARLLHDHPGLATARLGGKPACASGEMSRTLLHVATDWPGHYPRGAETVATLVAAGADVNARFEGPHRETPLHWAASSDDVAVLDALLDHGADIEAPGAVIGGGTPLADAAAFGQWNAARRLVERGAQTTLWEAAALGLLDRVQGHFAGQAQASWSPRPSRPGGAAPDEVTHAFWCACHGGQQQVAEYLLARGADLNWVGYDHLTPLDAARRTGANALVAWLFHRGARSAGEC